MRIVTLEPFLTELVCHFGLPEQLVGISHHPVWLEDPIDAEVLTDPDVESEGGLASSAVILQRLSDVEPDLILTSLPGDEQGRTEAASFSEKLSAKFGREIKVRSFSPKTLEQVYTCYAEVAAALGVREKGLRLAEIMKAETLNWADNFYQRTKGKKVSVLVGSEPLKLGGLWIPDVINLVSARGQQPFSGSDHTEIQWKEVLEFDPDVLIVAPDAADDESFASFLQFEKREHWDEVRAVKRGEVFFVSGARYFLRPSQHLREGFGIFISAVAGFESGYITVRDSFHRLRWLELQRHRFK
jgi:iron complex transport system substrate-binding protein